MKRPFRSLLRFAATVIAVFLVPIVLQIACGGDRSRSEDMGALTPRLLIGQDGVWHGELADGEYRMRNDTEDATAYYFSVESAAESQGKRSGRVDVTITGESPTSHAGLIYAVREDPVSFYYLALRPGPMVTVYRWEPEGVREISSVSGDDVSPGMNTLVFEEEDDRVRFFVGDHEVSSLSGPDVGSGQIGIAVWGRGAFTFDRFDLDPAPDSPGSQGAGPGGGPGEGPDVASSSAGGSRGGRSDAEVVHLRLVEIMDENGFGQPVVALRFLAPVDWQVRGGVSWGREYRCINDLVQVTLSATSPDSRLAFEMFPTYFAEWVEDDYELQVKRQAMQQGQIQCPLAPPFDAAAFLTQHFVPGYRSGATVRSIEPATATAREQSRKIREQFARAGMGSQDIQTDAASARIAYGNAEELVLASTYVTQMQGLSLSAAARGMTAMRTQYFSIAENVYAMKAPAGELDRHEQLFAVILGSLQINPAWKTAVTLVQANITRNNIRTIGDISQMWFEASREAQDIRNESWQETQKEIDRLAVAWSETMRGVATYRDPDDGSTVELVDGYDKVWAKNGNEFLLTTDPGFDPNIAFRDLSWNQLQRVSRP